MRGPVAPPLASPEMRITSLMSADFTRRCGRVPSGSPFERPPLHGAGVVGRLDVHGDVGLTEGDIEDRPAQRLHFFEKVSGSEGVMRGGRDGHRREKSNNKGTGNK